MKKSTTPTFLLELPLRVDAGQVKRLCAHFEAARCLYNALLGEAMKRLRQMRADAAWQEARAIPRAHKQERKEAFARLRQGYGFSEYALHEFAKEANCSWIADHIYARLVRRKASSSKAQGADTEGYRYYVQLALEGLSYQKPKHTVGSEVVGLDLGPSTIAIVPQEGEAQLLPLCAELQPDVRAKRRLQRKLGRQRRANNPQNYDDKGHIKKRGKQCLVWKNSKSYLATRRRLATKERKLAAHRKSLHGRLVHQIIRRGNTIRTEKLSYKAWQKQFGKSVGRNAPGMLIPKSRSRSVGILAPAASARCSVTCTQRSLQLISNYQTRFPLSPIPNGKVRTCACGQR